MMHRAQTISARFSSRILLALVAAVIAAAGGVGTGHAEEGSSGVRLDVDVSLGVGSGGAGDGATGAQSAEAAALHAQSVARHRDYLRGLTASYRMNAYTDHQIAGAITRFVTADGTREDGTGEDGTGDGAGRDGAVGAAAPAGPPREVVERALGMRADLPGAGRDSEETQRLLVRAFTQRHLNGYADLMWARWIERTNRFEAVHRENLYGAAAESRRPDLLFWTYLLRGSVEPVAAFVEQYEPFTLSEDAVVDEIIAVQHANRAANEAVVDELRHAMKAVGGGPGWDRGGGPAVGRDGSGAPEAPLTRKSALLIAYAAESPHPREFLRGAVAAQRGAGRWDGAFETLLRWRF